MSTLKSQQNVGGNMLLEEETSTSIGRQFVTTSSSPEHQDANSIGVSEFRNRMTVITGARTDEPITGCGFAHGDWRTGE
jgi:hypothetical protein